MRELFVAAIMALAAVTSARAACQIRVYGDLPLQPDPERALVKGQVNGHPVTFIVDTGAWASSMPYADARRLGVKLDDANAFESEGIGGRVNTAQGRFDMQLGQMALPNEAMTVMAMPSLDHNAVALVGLDLLVQHDLELNLPANDIKLTKVQGCSPADLTYWNPAGSVNTTRLETDGSARPPILINVLLNGHLVPAQLDSGSPQSIVTPAAARLAGGDLAKAEESASIGGVGSGRIPARVVTFDNFSIGGETIRNAKLIVSEMWKFNRMEETGTRLGSHTHDLSEPRMLLGADFLRAHRVLIVNSMRLMAFSYMGGPVFDITSQSNRGRGATPAAAQPH